MLSLCVVHVSFRSRTRSHTKHSGMHTCTYIIVLHAFVVEVMGSGWGVGLEVGVF